MPLKVRTHAMTRFDPTSASGNPKEAEARVAPSRIPIVESDESMSVPLSHFALHQPMSRL